MSKYMSRHHCGTSSKHEQKTESALAKTAVTATTPTKKRGRPKKPADSLKNTEGNLTKSADRQSQSHKKRKRAQSCPLQDNWISTYFNPPKKRGIQHKPLVEMDDLELQNIPTDMAWLATYLSSMRKENKTFHMDTNEQIKILADKQAKAIESINAEINTIKYNFSKLSKDSSSIKDRLTKVETTIAEVQKSSSQLTLDGVDKQNAFTSEQEKTLNEISTKLEKHEEKLLRNNAIIKGLQTTEENISSQILKFCSDKLSVQPKILEARLIKKSPSVVKFDSWESKSSVMRSKKLLTNNPETKSIYISPELTSAQQLIDKKKQRICSSM